MQVKKVGLVLGAIGLLAATLVLSACGGGGGSGSDTKPYSELLFVNDEYTLKAMDASGDRVVEVSRAAIPGIPGTYSRSGKIVTVTIPYHDLNNDMWVDLDFSAGTGGTATNGLYKVTVVDNHTFTVTDTASGNITSGTVVRNPVTALRGTYTQTGSTITVTVPNHGISPFVMWDLKLDFTSGEAVDAALQVASVVDADTFTVTAAADATTSGNVTVMFGANYGIFDIAMHPSGKWLYASSTYECWSGTPFCGNNTLISRFAIDWTTGKLRFEESVPASVESSDTVSTLAFSPDGSRLFSMSKWTSRLNMWSVAPATGELTRLDNDTNANGHALAVAGDGSRVYHGSKVFTVSGNTLTYGGSGADAQSGVVTNGMLYTNTQSTIIAYDLTDPDLPAPVASANVSGTNSPREIAVSPDGSLIVSAGEGGLKVYSFVNTADTQSIAPAVGAGSTEYIDGSWAGLGSTYEMFRTVTLNGDGSRVAAAYFTYDGDSNTVAGFPPSGVMLFSLAADGTLTKLADYDQATYARAARFYTKPN